MMRNGRCCLVGLAIYTAALAAFAEDKHAILVGISRQDDGLVRKYAEKDVQGLAVALKSQGFTAHTMLGSARDDSRATKDSVEAAFRKAIQGKNPGDIVLFVFVGPGQAILNPSSEKQNHPDVICDVEFFPTDTEREDCSSTLLLSHFFELSQQNAGFSLFLFDVFHDSKPLPRVADSAMTLAERMPDNCAVLFGSRPTQASLESESLREGAGLFSYHLVQGLKGPSRTSDGLTWARLSNHVRRETPVRGNELFPDRVRAMAERTGTEVSCIELQSPFEMKRLNSMPVLGRSKTGKSSDSITNSIGMRLVRVRAGAFGMGASADQLDQSKCETLHRVELFKDFFIGAYEVTQAEYECLMGRNPSHFSPSGQGRSDVRRLNTDRFPVEQVSWNDAVTFCERLSKKEGKRYRLPTEAEWEYACRAGTTSAFWWGDEIERFQVNCDADATGCSHGIFGHSADYLGRTEIVGAYDANAFGLYDTHGNVAEWCQDWFECGYYGRTPLKNPPGPEKGSRRVIRGGDFRRYAFVCHSAFRMHAKPETQDRTIGFRAVLEL
jgi:formylglycine-generating enzyme required for sulfatase activity